MKEYIATLMLKFQKPGNKIQDSSPDFTVSVIDVRPPEVNCEFVTRAGPNFLVARCKKKMEAPFTIKIEKVKLAIGYNKQTVNR